MRPRHTLRRDIQDGNAKDIINVLRGYGVEVVETERPLDILIHVGDGQCGFAEIKTESRNAGIRRSQIEFMANTNMPVAFVKTPDEALEFAKTMEGLTARQKLALSAFLVQDARPRFYPATVEAVLNAG